MPQKVDLKSLPYKQLAHAAKDELNVRRLSEGFDGVRKSELVEYFQTRLDIWYGDAISIVDELRQMGFIGVTNYWIDDDGVKFKI